MVTSQTCVSEALLLAECRGVHAMHDTTEGGLVAAINEMADTSHLGFEIQYEALPIVEEVKNLQKMFTLSIHEILSISSTGCIIVSIAPTQKDTIVKVLNQNRIIHKVIGRFSYMKDRTITINKKKNRFPTEAQDPYGKILYST
jgi:hydrogenase maturation factor